MAQEEKIADGRIVMLDEPPKAGTAEMVGTLTGAIEQLLQQIPLTFYNGDVMAAALSIVINTGLRAVTDGAASKEQVEADILKAVKIGIANFKPGEGSALVFDTTETCH